MASIKLHPQTELKIFPVLSHFMYLKIIQNDEVLNKNLKHEFIPV